MGIKRTKGKKDHHKVKNNFQTPFSPRITNWKCIKN